LLEYGVGGFPWQRSQGVSQSDKGRICADLGVFQANAGDFVYVFYGTLDKPTDLPPKGEFFCSRRDNWMPEVPSECRSTKSDWWQQLIVFSLDLFHKQKIQE